MSRSIAVVATSPYQVALFLLPHLRMLQETIPVQIYTNVHDEYSDLLGDVEVIHVPITRMPYLAAGDLRSLGILKSQLRRTGASTVETISPKGGLLGQVAARMANVPGRVHIFTGQPWASKQSTLIGRVAKRSDWAIARLTTHLLADSQSQARFLSESGVVPAARNVRVLGAGSIRGVDLQRFREDPQSRASVRQQYGAGSEATVFIYVGRLARDKGVRELLVAFSALRAAWRAGVINREPQLWVLGQDEEGLQPEVSGTEGARYFPFARRPEHIIVGADILVLPSYREGFGSTIIEAAAIGIPAIGSRIPGIVDAIVDAETGWLVEPGSPSSLEHAMRSALQDPEHVKRLGRSASARARTLFESSIVTKAYADHLREIHERTLNER